MADISKITLPNGNTYDIKDSWARSEIESLEAIDNGVRLIGVTTTALTDNATTNPITVDSKSYTAVKGDLVFYENKEFLFDGTKWHLLDELSTHGTLATKNSVVVKYTKTTGAALAAAPTFTGTASSVTISSEDNTNGNYEPKGNITGQATAFTGTQKAATVTGNLDFSGTGVRLQTGNIAVPTSAALSNTALTASATYTPEGTVTTATTENKTTTVSAASSGTATYTPGGSVTLPTIVVDSAGSTNNTLKPVTAKSMVSGLATAAPGATAPANAITYYAVSDETLSFYQIGATKADSVTLGSAVTVKTGDASYKYGASNSSTTATLTGTGVRLVTGNIAVPKTFTFAGTEDTISSTGNVTSGTVSLTTSNKTATVSAVSGTATYTPGGSITQPSSGGTSVSFSGNYTPEGTISGLGFSGTKAMLSGTTTATGNISKPNITLTQADNTSATVSYT